MFTLHSCSKEQGSAERDRQEVELIFRPEALLTKTINPDETAVSDINLYVFSEDGFLEDYRYLSSRQINKNNGEVSVSLLLVRGIKVSLVCCANFGFELGSFSRLSELEAYRFSLAYPDELKEGIPMVGKIEKVWTTEENSIVIPLERMMSKISVSMDRTELDKDVKITVKGVGIGNCPRSAVLIGPSTVRGNSDVFNTGYRKDFSEADNMNVEESPGISKEVSLYMLENMMGDLLDDTVDDSEKLVESTLANSCSYIEIDCEYSSDEKNSKAGEYLKYRFYLGGSNGNFDVERNCHYHFVIQPMGDGLGDNSWRIDKTALE